MQLALSLLEDAMSCMLLSSKDRLDHSILVGALQRHFGEFHLRESAL